MQPLAMMLTAGIVVWLVVYLFATNGSALAATIMACATMFAVLMLKIRENEGLTQRGDPVRMSSITPRPGVPVALEPAATEGAAPFRNQPPPKYSQPFTMPTQDNPLMNVLPPNDGVYGNRPPAAPVFNRQVEQRVNDSVVLNVAGTGMLTGSEASKDSGDTTRARLYMDLGGEIDLADSMRVFNAMPSTTTPNDQTGFAEYCYGAVGSCARGGELFCVPEPVLGDDGTKGRYGGYKTSGQDVLQPPSSRMQLDPASPDHDGLSFATTKARKARALHGYRQ